MASLVNIRQFSKDGYIYRPANRSIISLGVPVYTPIMRFQLQKFKTFDKIMNFFLGPEEPAIPLPEIIYIKAGVMGRFTFEESGIYAYRVKYKGIGCILQKNQDGFYTVKYVIEQSPSYLQGLKPGDEIIKIKIKNRWTNIQGKNLGRIAEIFASERSVQLMLKGRKEPIKIDKDTLRLWKSKVVE